MIDFRYHIVSLIAVFLALGIGIIMGTTVVQRAIVADQERVIDSLNERFKKERSDKEDAEGKLALWDRFGKDGEKFFVGGRLGGQKVTVVTAQGVPKDWADATIAVMRQAGAQVPAVVTFTDKWKLGEQTARDQLAHFTGASPDSGLEALQRSVIVNLAAKLGNAQPSSGEAPLLKTELAATLIGQLADSGFLDVKGVDVQQNLDPNALGGAGALAVVVGADDISVPLDSVYIPFTVEMGRGGHTLAVQGISNGGPQLFIDGVRSQLSKVPTISTVDNINMQIGQYAAAVALQQELNGVYEQLGVGVGAQSLLPSRVG